jgi:transcriptional regulator with XRE-family HTH domain
MPAPAKARLTKAFGQTIRQLRIERGMSQEALSFACSRHRTYISLVERGLHSATLQTLFNLAEALSLNPSEIVQRTEAAFKKK